MNAFDDRDDHYMLYTYPKASKPKSKSPSKNKNLPNKHPNVVKKLNL